MINVDGSDDPSYRYKMPRLVSKVEGKGNGVKTVLMNCSEIATALYRSTGQVCKYFGCELGAMTNYDEAVDKALVNGAFDTGILQEALTGYINRFVLCPSCNNPETIQEIKGKKKSAVIMLKCKACGALGEADNTHKLVTYIIKEKSNDTSVLSKKELRKQRRNERNKKKGVEEKTVSSVSDDEQREKRKKKKKRSKDKTKKDLQDDDVKKKKKKKKKKKVKVKAVADEMNSDSEEEENNVDGIAADLGELTVNDIAVLDNVVDKVSNGIKAGSNGQELLEFVELQQSDSGLRKAERIPILLYSLLYVDISLVKLTGILSTFAKVVAGVKSSFLQEKEVELSILTSWEEGIARLGDDKKRERALSLVPLFLKSFYDEELIEETTLLQWAKKSLDGKKYKHSRCVVEDDILELIKLRAKPVIEWLETADSDSDDSDTDN